MKWNRKGLHDKLHETSIGRVQIHRDKTEQHKKNYSSIYLGYANTKYHKSKRHTYTNAIQNTHAHIHPLTHLISQSCHAHTCIWTHTYTIFRVNSENTLTALVLCIYVRYSIVHITRTNEHTVVHMCWCAHKSMC